MKRVAIYINTRYSSGGTFQYTKALIEAIGTISDTYLKLIIIYTEKSWDEYLRSILNSEKIYFSSSASIIRLYKLLISFGLSQQLRYFAGKTDKIIKHINKQNYDIVLFPAGDAISCLVNTQVLIAVHDLMHRYERRFKESGGFFNYRYRENFFKYHLKYSCAAIADSELGERQIEESYSVINAKIFILPYIAPEYIYLNSDNAISGFRNEKETKKYLFYPAQFWPHKNHINLLRALKILKSRGVDINLVLSGSKDREYSKLKKFVEINSLKDNVKFKGFISDTELVNLYREAFALVMPTYYGPTNIPPIEAILLGCPPIVSNIYGMPRQLESAALYFDPDDPIEIAERIESLIKNDELRNKIVNNGEKIKSKFSMERFRSDIKSIFDSIFETC